MTDFRSDPIHDRLSDALFKPRERGRKGDARAWQAPLPTVRLRRVAVHAITERQAVGHVIDQLHERQGGWIVTVNLDHLRRIESDAAYERLSREADLIVADGMPLIWASRLQGQPLPERVAGSNMIRSLSGAAAERGYSVFLLGGEPGTAEQAGRILQGQYPHLRVAGTCCPPPGFEEDARWMGRIERELRQSQPDVVFVALGSPKQERVIARMRRLLPGTWWLGVGISFSFVCGRVRRAPQVMQRLGLEWVHRLAQEPRRLARRYLLEGVPFAMKLLVWAAWQRWRGR